MMTNFEKKTLKKCALQTQKIHQIASYGLAWLRQNTSQKFENFKKQDEMVKISWIMNTFEKKILSRITKRQMWHLWQKK